MFIGKEMDSKTKMKMSDIYSNFLVRENLILIPILQGTENFSILQNFNFTLSVHSSLILKQTKCIRGYDYSNTF